jgi:hypothetical protein
MPDWTGTEPPPPPPPEPEDEAGDWLRRALEAAERQGITPSPSDDRLPPTVPATRHGVTTGRGTLVSELKREIASVNFRAEPPEDPAEMGELITKARSIVRRLVNISIAGRDREAIEAARLIFAYMEGLPVQPVEFDVAKVVMALAEDRGLDKEDIDRAKAETIRIINQARSGAPLT